MEQSKVIENHDNSPADKVKAPSTYSEDKESYKSSELEEFLKKAQGIPSVESDSEAKKEISPATVPKTNNSESKLNETLSVKSPKMEKPNIKFVEEPSPKETSTGPSLKSQTQAKEQTGDKESTVAKSETSILKAKPPVEDQAAGSTSTEAKQKDKTEDSKSKKSQAFKQEKDKPKDTKSVKSEAAKKPAKNKSEEAKPEGKALDVEEPELYKQGSAKEILMEQEGRKTWKSLLTEVSLVSSLSTFKLLYEKSSTSPSTDASVRKRSAKELYKKKLRILRENYAYRLGLLKQLKQAMRDKYNSEAQQLYSDYISAKKNHEYLKSIDLEKSSETDPSKDTAAIDSLG